MYNGRHASSVPAGGEKRRKRSASPSRGSMGKRKLGLILALVLLLTVAGGGTLAWLQAGSEKVTNKMEPGEVPITIQENVTGTTKESVNIVYSGNVPAYIRVTVTSNAVDESGNLVPGTAPEISGVNNNWQEIDNYYYYKEIVYPGDTDTVVIPFLSKQSFAGGRVDIVAQSIQALGGHTGDGNASVDAWGVRFDGTEWKEA